MTGIVIKGSMIDVYKQLRDLSWKYPGATLHGLLSGNAIKEVIQDQLSRIASEVAKKGAVEHGKSL